MTVTFEVQDISHILLKSTMFCKCNSTDNVIICVIFDNQNYLQNFLKRIGKVKIICDVNWYAHISLILSFDLKDVDNIHAKNGSTWEMSYTTKTYIGIQEESKLSFQLTLSCEFLLSTLL